MLSILVASSKFPSQPVGGKTKLPLASDPINYTIGVLPDEEYTWIITLFQEKNLELVFGSNWTDELGLFGIPQLGHKFKANVTSTHNNITHYFVNFAEWDCLYRSDNFSITRDSSSKYKYPIFPQNYTDTIEFDCVLPLFLPIPLVSYVFDSNLSATYYDAMDFTSYGSGLYVYYDRLVNVDGSVINLGGIASYLENGVLDYYEIFYNNGSERIECLVIETFEPYHLERTSMGCEVGDEFTWVLVNYNLTALEFFFGEEFFEKFGLLPDPDRMQSIKMKVDGVSENDTSWGVDYSLFDWTSLEDNFSTSSAQNSSYLFSKEPFNETRSIDGPVPFLIPQPTELFLNYGRFGDCYTPYNDLYSFVSLTYSIGLETLYGSVFYNPAGVLTTMIFRRSIQVGGRTELQIAFEIALYYDSPTSEYVGIEEGALFNYNIYTNYSIPANLIFPTKHYQNMSVEVINIFGEDSNSGRTPFVANLSMQGEYDLWELKDVLIVGYIHSDSNMYFDPLIVSGVSPFVFAPIFANNNMNWTEFALSYNNYSIIGNSNYYSVSELPNGFNLHQRDYEYNVTSSYKYNESGVLTEFTVYYNDYLYHNCTLEKISPPPIEIDTDPPVITVVNPSSEKLFGVSPPVYNLIIEEEHLNYTWLSLSNGTTEFRQELSFTNGETIVEISGQVSQSAWNCFTDGNLTVRFYANDSSGNLVWTEISVIKDATAPLVSILDLESGQIFNGTAPEFELTIKEAHLNCTWYVVNGSEKVYFEGISGAIDQIIWDSLPNGSVSVQFFALDETGNLGTVAVAIVKQVKSEPNETSESLTPIVIQLSFGMIGLATISWLAIRRRKRN